MLLICLNKSNLKLFEGVFKLNTNIQFEWIKDDEYECRSADKPLHHLTEWITSLLLSAIFDDSGCVNECDLFEQLSRHLDALKSLKE